jgi:hypothetical protein
MTIRAPPRQKVQRDYPGSALFSDSESAIKRITAGVKACRWFSRVRIGPATGLHPPDVFNVERKKNTAF